MLESTVPTSNSKIQGDVPVVLEKQDATRIALFDKLYASLETQYRGL